MAHHPNNKFRLLRGWYTSCVLVLALVTLAPLEPASAEEITYVSVAGSWRDPVDNLPGSQPGDPVITNGDPLSIVRWGTTTTGNQSGYNFTASIPPPFTLPGTIPFFSLGDFEHLNFSVDSPSLVSVELDVVLELAVDGVPTGPLTFSFTFNHEETPNNPTPPDTCPYPTPPGEGCTDRVTIVRSADPTTFNVGGVDYTLDMTFLDDAGNPVDEFITREGGTVNYSGLAGEFTVLPGLRMNKTGPTEMRLFEWGEFILDSQNDGDSPAYDVTLVDRLPDGPTGGMCDLTPEILSAQVFAADGVTPLPGKGPLSEGPDYSLAYDGSTCELTFVTLSPAAVIDVGERLIIRYRTQLDTDTQDDIILTNVAGATAWFSDVASNPARVAYLRNLTDGSITITDHEDAHSVNVDLLGAYFEKTVANVTTGVNPATTAAPGDDLRYTFRLRTTERPLTDVRIFDDLGELNATTVFQPGSLVLVPGTIPPGAIDNSNPNGGTNGAGLLDISGISLPTDSEVVIEFDITLETGIPGGTVVSNQADLLDVNDLTLLDSDDPNVNGIADPDVLGDEDPTRILVQSAPAFLVEKISTDLTGDPAVLMAGDTLRYTITVQNYGTESATNVTLVDQVPASTAYVPDSTTLNGVAIPDGALPPLVNGILINAPEDPTPGVMNPGVPDNVATIEFDVVVDIDVADGTVISNQGFVSAPDAFVLDVPSDDPDTPAINDPTLDVVGPLPLLYAEKSAVLQLDGGTPNVVDPLDTLLYTITVYNFGNMPATLVDLTDAVPVNTTYVDDTTFLNTEPVGQPDSGVFPLAGGLPISSSDLTPPLPLVDEGTINPGEAATVQFEVLVDDLLPPGTLITNQAVVASYELNDVLTDGDGNPATGPEPTVVVVGDVQQLAITKQVVVVGGGAAQPGSTLEYLVTATNIGTVPAYFVEIYDDLDVPDIGHLTYVGGTATLNGLPDGVTVTGPLLVADYFNTYGTLNPGETARLRFRAVVDASLPIGTTVINTAEARWNDPQDTITTSVAIDLGGTPGSAALNGTIWHDADYDDTLDSRERLLAGWTVELYRNGQLIFTTLTDVDGVYRIGAVPPNYLSNDLYEVRFTAPGAGGSTALLGEADSEFSNDLQRIYDIVVQPGDNLLDLNLPIDPNGVVYNSVSRTPLAGATVTLLAGAGGAPLPDTCFDDPAQQNQVTRADGYYKFDLNFLELACPSGGDYTVQVVAPPGNFVPGLSQIIPPDDDPALGPFDVPACPGLPDDAVALTLNHCEIQPSEFAPGATVPARSVGTRYLTYLTLDDSQPSGTSQIFNNHVPLDPDLSGLVTVSKTTSMVNVTRGQLVPYKITVNSTYDLDLTGVAVVDRPPAGFKYVEGSARIDGVPAEPELNGRELVWPGLTLDASGQHDVQLLLAVGAGVSEGEFVNRAQVMNEVTGLALSEQATAMVRLVPDPTFDCTDVTGKVYDDSNRNGLQDNGEEGLGGVRLVTTRGLAATTDAYGRFHITCAITPNENRGSNFVLKLDDRTLPSGYRASTREVQIRRATRGKALNFDFGASIHRVVAIDLADPVFEPGQIELREMWRPRLGLLMEELQKAPSVLRLSYLADVEDPGLVNRRVKAIKSQLSSMWAEMDCCYSLDIETEVHWRLGGPPAQSGLTGGVRSDD